MNIERVFPVPHLAHSSWAMVQLNTRLPPLTLSSTIDLHYRAAPARLYDRISSDFLRKGRAASFL